jgi:hypothetical protein
VKGFGRRAGHEDRASGCRSLMARLEARVGHRGKFALSRVQAPVGVVNCPIQTSLSPFKLVCPLLPTMMWSCTAIPSGVAISMIAFVISISACEGVGSPEG